MSDYDSCKRTFVTLRIYSKSITPMDITTVLGILPSKSQTIGDPRKFKGKNLSSKVSIHGWFLSSEKFVKSKDSRMHIDWLEDVTRDKLKYLKRLQKMGCSIDICCFWLQKVADGGPTLSKKQISFLGKTGLDFWYDFYSNETLEKVLLQNNEQNKKPSPKIGLDR